jgi:hypothetical protein
MLYALCDFWPGKEMHDEFGSIEGKSGSSHFNTRIGEKVESGS